MAGAILAVLVFSLQFTQTANAAILPDPTKTIHPDLDSKFERSVGQSAEFRGSFVITILDVIDSRCPIDGTCIWEGKVEIPINVVKNSTDLGRFILSSPGGRETSQEIGGHTITLSSVQPYPKLGKEIPKSHYILSLVVSEKLKPASPFKQVVSGISPENVICKMGLKLVAKTENGNPACIKQSSISKLYERGWGLPFDKLTISYFVDTTIGAYKTGQEIQFTINFDGISTNCSYPTVTVKDHDGKTVWQSNQLVLLCDSDEKPYYSIKEWNVGHSNLGDLIINHEGRYTMKVEYGKKILEKDFRVIF